MNVISFRVLFVCIFLPPIMYVFSIQILEHYLQNTRTKDLQNVIIQDFDALYNGRHSIKEEIRTLREKGSIEASWGEHQGSGYHEKKEIALPRLF